MSMVIPYISNLKNIPSILYVKSVFMQINELFYIIVNIYHLYNVNLFLYF